MTPQSSTELRGVVVADHDATCWSPVRSACTRSRPTGTTSGGTRVDRRRAAGSSSSGARRTARRPTSCPTASPPARGSTSTAAAPGGSTTGVLFFSNWSDQRLHRLDPGGEPRPLTPEGCRYADMDVAPDGTWLVAVREDHRGEGEARNEIVRIDTTTGDEPCWSPARTSSPRPGSTGLAGAAGLDPVEPPRHALGRRRGVGRRCCDGRARGPGWPAGRASGRPAGRGPAVASGSPATGRRRRGRTPAVRLRCIAGTAATRAGLGRLARRRRPAALGVPDVLARRLDAEDPSRPAGRSGHRCPTAGALAWEAHGRRGRPGTGSTTCALRGPDAGRDRRAAHGRLVARPRTGRPRPPWPPRSPANQRSWSDRRTNWSSSGRLATSASGRRRSACPESIDFPSAGGRTAHALYYPPTNPDHVGPDGEKPPLLVDIHGGPTAAARSQFQLGVQFWTSRGFAVVDVNYGGSTGYGRAYPGAAERSVGGGRRRGLRRRRRVPGRAR